MKHSIRLRMVVIFGAVLIGTIAACIFINNTFLEKYYEKTKIDGLTGIYNNINLVYTGDDVDEEQLIAIEQSGERLNAKVYIFDIYMFSGGMLYQVKYPANLNRFDQEQFEERIKQYYALQNVDKFGNKGSEAIESTDDYSVYMRYDNRLNANYIELFGRLSSGQQIFIRTNFVSIQDNVDIANHFFMYTGGIAVIIGIIVMLFVSRNFTRPITELAKIADEMNHLNFEAKYKTTRKDEIGILGASINSLSENLEKTISELKSANNELQKDIEKKEEIDEMRREFLSNVSHELKTPIALIQGYAEGLKDNISSDEESRNFYCDVIMDEAGKMNTLVRKLLTLNQIEFGNDQVEYERFNLNDVIRSVVNASDIVFKQKEVQLSLDLDDNIFVWADEYRIEEVVTNYVSNALNHVCIPEGESAPRICITAKRAEGRIRVGVFNTGKPIPESDIDHIWEKFYKVDKARTREYGGSGIGLSIVKAVMDSMNSPYGVINYENGVEFWFALDDK